SIGGEGNLACVDILLEAARHQPEELAADAHEGAFTDDRRGSDTHTVEIRPVVTAEVDQLERAVGAATEFGVMTGRQLVVDDEVVLAGPSDTHRCGGRLVDRGQVSD